jgi:SEC-C motif-containing protein
MTTVLCPCGSDQLFEQCCDPIINGVPAKTAEELMRSRYSAYVLGHWQYLWESWHLDTRPSSVSPTNTEWLGLSIVKSTSSTVEFIAGFREGSKIMVLHETSRFEQVDNRWCYLDGICDITEAGRNTACPCGSGKKTKRCCGRL